MSPMHRAFLFSAACLVASAAQLRAQDPGALVGTWRSSDGTEPAETVAFRADRTLLVDGSTVRYAATGSRLTISSDAGTARGTWEIRDGELLLTFALPDQETKTGRYRRVAEVARLRVGRVACEAPLGWTVVRENGDGAVLNPGFAATDTLDALVIVMHGALRAAEREAPLERVVRDRLPELAAELRGQAIVADLGDPITKLVRTASGEGVVIATKGRANGTRDVRVWLGVVRDDASFAVVLGVLTVERAKEFVPQLARLHETMSFAKASPENATLAGAEFGHSSFGSGGNSLTTVYSFGPGGSVTRRTMFSSSVGGSDRSERGTWTLAGETVRMTFADHTTEARLVGGAGGVVALQIGASRYAKS